MRTDVIVVFHFVLIFQFALSTRAAPREPKEKVECSQLVTQASRWLKLAFQHWDAGQFAAARPLAEQSIKAREKCIPQDLPSLADSLHMLGLIHASLQSYSEAVPILQRALELRLKSVGPNHPDTARSLGGLAMLYRSVGQYQRAAEHYEHALQILQRTHNRNHSLYPALLNNFAGLYVATNRYQEAHQNYQQALELWSTQHGPSHFLVGVATHNLGDVLAKQGHFELAVEKYLLAIAIWQRTWGRRHPYLANGLARMADAYAELGQPESAKRAYEEALALQTALLGPGHPDVGRTRRGLAVLYARQGRIRESCQQVELALEQLNEFLHNQGPSLPKDQYEQFVDSVQEQESILYSTLYPHLSDPDVATLVLALALHRKGRTLDEAAEFSRMAYSALDATDRAKFDRMHALRGQFATLTLAGPGPRLSANELRNRLESLSAEADKIEENLAQRSVLLRQQARPPRGTQIVSRVAASLPPDGMLIEYVSVLERRSIIATGQPPRGRHYLAFTLSPNGQVAAIDLGPATKIDETVSAFHAALRNPDRSLKETRAIGNALYRQILAPLAPTLHSAAWLLLSPDGALNHIPFAALHDGEGYLEDRYMMSYVTSGRDLLRRHQTCSSCRDLIVFADPSFSRKTTEPPFFADAGRSGSRTVQRMHVDQLQPLPGTREEALAIQRTFPQARLLLGSEATESTLLKITAPLVLHIATHALFMDDDDIGHATRSLHSHFDEGDPAPPGHPLLRSALLLAGASASNSTLAEKEIDRPDGIVTALELAGMNLWGTELVVLSACSTGRGIVKIGQGIYGLRRAILAAGAASLVASLWKVDDKITERLMASFYGQLKTGVRRVQALRQAAKIIRSAYPHPYYWASFGLTGEGGPLDLARPKTLSDPQESSRMVAPNDVVLVDRPTLGR